MVALPRWEVRLNWSEGPLLAIDFETTGIDPHTARPVTCALVRIEEGEAFTVVNLMDCGVEIPEEAAKIHGWTTERLRDEQAEPPEVVMPIIRAMVYNALREGVPLVAFNARYDLTLLNAELVRGGLEPLEYRRVIDPLIIDKAIDTYRPGKRQLGPMCYHYQVKLEDAHDAGHDAIAVARLAWRMGHDLPALGEMDLDELHDAQVQWAYDQAVSFKSFLEERYGQTDRRVAGGWPVETGPDDDVPLRIRRRYHTPQGNGGYGDW